MPDAALLGLVASGDRDAHDELTRRYRPSALASASRFVGPEIVEDVVQEALLGAWRTAGNFDPSRGSARSWILTIVRHKAIDAARRRRPTSELPDASTEWPTTLSEPEPWIEILRRHDADTITLALEQLPPVQRQAVELAFFEELTHREIAERTGAPLGTVKSRVRLGLLRLRRALGDEE